MSKLEEFYDSIHFLFHPSYADEIKEIYIRNGITPEQFYSFYQSHGGFATGNNMVLETVLKEWEGNKLL